MIGRNLGLRQLAKNSVFNFGRQIWSILIGLMTSILLARGLGTENRGIYAVVVVFISLFVTFLNAGIGTASVYYIARRERRLDTAVRENLWFSLISSVIGLVIGVLIIFFAHDLLFPGISFTALFLALIAIPITLQRDNLQMIFLGLEDFMTYNLIGLIPQTITLILTFILVWLLRLEVEGALAALIIGNFISLLIVIFALRRLIRPEHIFPLHIDLKQARQLLGYGLQVHISNIIAFFNFRADVFLLNLLSTKTDVGLYDVAVSLGERLWILSGAVSTVIFPRVAALQNEEDKQHLTQLVARHILWLSLIMTAITYVVAEWAIVLLFGEEFRGASLALRLLLPGIIMESVSKILANDIAGRGRPGINAKLAALAALINIVANLVLIPRFEFAGSAIATSLSYSVLAITLIFWFCRLTGANWRELIVPTREDFQRFRYIFRWGVARLLRKPTTP